jgi:hypothetical protein
MYYDTRIINGILHYRLSPLEKWTPFSQEELTALYLMLKRELNELYLTNKIY